MGCSVVHLVGAMVVIVAAVAACDHGHRDSPPQATSEHRVVSLSPALTHTLIELGMREAIVGRTPFCRGVDDVPIVGDLTSVDYERLMQVAATHLLVQPPAGGVDRTLLGAATSAGIDVCDWEINTAGDVLAMLQAIPDCLRLGEGLTARCVELAASIDQAIHREPEQGGVISPILIVSPGPSPLGHGRGTYLGELLDLQGEVNALETIGWRQLSMEDVVRLDPRTIIIVNDTGDVDTDSLIAVIGAGGTEAATERRICVLTHPESLRPSPALREVAAEFFDHLDALRTGPGS